MVNQAYKAWLTMIYCLLYHQKQQLHQSFLLGFNSRTADITLPPRTAMRSYLSQIESVGNRKQLIYKSCLF